MKICEKCHDNTILNNIKMVFISKHMKLYTGFNDLCSKCYPEERKKYEEKVINIANLTSRKKINSFDIALSKIRQ